jgi:hypothetical protein
MLSAHYDHQLQNTNLIATLAHIYILFHLIKPIILYRWRVNSREFALPFSKKGLLRGYMKYGAFTYIAWYYTKEIFAQRHHKDAHGPANDGDGHGHSP